MEKYDTIFCKCGKSVTETQLCMVLYDKRTEESKEEITEEEKEGNTEKSAKEETLILGAVEAELCESCLARQAWKSIGIAFLKMLIGLIVASALVWLIGMLFHLSWIGAVIVALLLVVNFIREIPAQTKNVAASLTENMYKKRGTISKDDFIWMSREGLTLMTSEKIDIKKVTVVSAAKIESTLKKASADDIDAQAMKLALTEALSHASERVSSEPPKIKRAFWYPIAVGLFVVGELFVFYVLIHEMIEIMASDAQSFSIEFVLAGAFIILSVIGALLLLLKKNAIGYLPIVVSIIVIWIVSIKMWGDYFSNHLNELVIITLIILISALCHIPYLKNRRIFPSE